ncbi:MAG: hypothetical protein ACRELC_08865, partial [Gemmatimonadota bacterium]
LHAVNQTLAGPALLRRARIEEALGQDARAAHHYRAYLDIYDLASGPYAAAREEAVAALWRFSGAALPAGR